MPLRNVVVFDRGVYYDVIASGGPGETLVEASARQMGINEPPV
jgi:hypothetical protein